MSYGESVPPLEFAGMRIACLSGDNGSGKTTLLDALTWALWGETRAPSEDDVIRLGASDCRVLFDFLIEGVKYRVHRARNRRAGSVWELQIWQEDGTLRSLSGASARETKQRLEGLLRMDYKTFLATAYLAQGRADEFTRAPVAERKKVLADILDLSRYEQLEQRAKEKRAEAEARELDAEREMRAIDSELAYEDMHAERTKAFFADLGALLDDDLVADLEHRRCTRLRDGSRLFEDTLPCLDWLRAAGVRLAAVTNASGSHQRAKLDRLGIGRFFDTVIIAGELGAAKPDPVIFHTACARLDVPAEATLHVGDLLEADALGARDAGLHGVWLDRALTACHEVRTDAGVHVIESLADLPELLVTEYRTPDLSGGPAPISGVDGLWSNISSRH
jgi:putative hydrolase of the HAD superfamily